MREIKRSVMKSTEGVKGKWMMKRKQINGKERDGGKRERFIRSAMKGTKEVKVKWIMKRKRKKWDEEGWREEGGRHKCNEEYRGSGGEVDYKERTKELKEEE